MHRSKSMVYIISCINCIRNRKQSIRVSTATLCHPATANTKRYYQHTADQMGDKTSLVKAETFDKVPDHLRKKETFISMCRGFNRSVKNDLYKSNHVEFILKALEMMENFGVNRDIDCYNAILDCFPKDVMVAENWLQTAFHHFPRQQEVCLKVLCQMAKYSIIPDKRTYLYIRDAFGEEAHPMRKLQRMMYWGPKFMNANPYHKNMPSVKEGMPDDALLLAILALEKMVIDRQNKISIFQSKDVTDSKDDTFIASAQSPSQMELISKLSSEHAVFVCGPFDMWLRYKYVTYFTLISEYNDTWRHPRQRGLYEDDEGYETVDEWQIPLTSSSEGSDAAAAPTLSIHEQSDQVVLSMCVTGTGSLDSLRSWIKLLQRHNPHLRHVPVLFRIRSQHADIATRDRLLQEPRKGKPATKPMTTIEGL